MLKSFAVFLATYAATAIATYLLAYSPLPLLVSYQRYACDPGTEFYPYDGLVVCGLVAGFLSAFAVRRLAQMSGERVVDTGSLRLWHKITTFGLFGIILITAAIRHATEGCGVAITESGVRIAVHATLLSFGYAVMGYVWFDLRRTIYKAQST